MRKKEIIIFTQSYPYSQSGEQMFLKHEISYLLKYFSEVTVVPENISGDKVLINKHIQVDESFHKFVTKRIRSLPRFRRITGGIHIPLLLNVFIDRPKVFSSKRNLFRLLYSIQKYKIVKEWFKSSNYPRTNNTLFYTYWFTPTTYAISTFIQNTVITRVHGTDLYEERHSGYIPLRKYAISKIDRIYCVSRAGKAYLERNYPIYKSKYKVSRLGTKRVFQQNRSRIDNDIFRVVSCSSLVKLKRVELILRGLIEFSNKTKDLLIEWIHFGGGPMFEELSEKINQIDSDKMKILFLGQVDNDLILNFYATRDVKVFITASETEGGVPVSIMEAQSYGIPVIATDVGGIPEIITDGDKSNGLLMSANPSHSELANKLLDIYRMGEEEYRALQKNSYETWYKDFRAEENFEEFAREISRL